MLFRRIIPAICLLLLLSGCAANRDKAPLPTGTDNGAAAESPMPAPTGAPSPAPTGALTPAPTESADPTPVVTEAVNPVTPTVRPRQRAQAIPQLRHPPYLRAAQS